MVSPRWFHQSTTTNVYLEIKKIYLKNLKKQSIMSGVPVNKRSCLLAPGKGNFQKIFQVLNRIASMRQF